MASEAKKAQDFIQELEDYFTAQAAAASGKEPSKWFNREELEKDLVAAIKAQDAETYGDYILSEVAEELDTHKPLIRNNLTLLFGEQKSADLRSPEGKQQLQDKVKESIQQVIHKYGSGGEVENIFFTNFVMQ